MLIFGEDTLASLGLYFNESSCPAVGDAGLFCFGLLDLDGELSFGLDIDRDDFLSPFFNAGGLTEGESLIDVVSFADSAFVFRFDTGDFVEKDA